MVVVAPTVVHFGVFNSGQPRNRLCRAAGAVPCKGKRATRS